MDGVRLVRAHALVGAASLGLAVLVGCSRDGGAKGARANAGPYAKEVSEAVPKIEKAVGLTFKTPPRVERRSKDEVRNFLTQKFNESMPAAEISGIERTYRRFGLISDTLQLRPFMLELLTEQVVGYYDPSTKVLYVVDGADPTMVGVTVTHELVHALQDQYLNLDSIQKVTGDNDRQVAAQAVIEGQATFEQVKAMLGSNSLSATLPGGWDRIRDMIREGQSSMPVFSSAPMIIQETLIFPYLSGAEFMRHFDETHPGKVPFDSMPVSTEQILHRPPTSRRGMRRRPSRSRNSVVGRDASTRTTSASSRRASFCSSTSAIRTPRFAGLPGGTAIGSCCSTRKAETGSRG